MNETFEKRPQRPAVRGNICRPDPPQRRQQAGIQKHQLRRLDEPFQIAAMPSANAAYQEHVFEQGKPAVDHLAVHAELRPQRGHVEQPAGGQGRVVDQANHLGRLPDRGKLGNIAFGEGARIGAQPRPPARRRGAGQGLGKAAGNDAPDQVGGGSGARWISSITAVGCPRMKPVGSSWAKRLNWSSSSVTKGRPSLSPMRRASAVLPDWRGPTRATMRVSASAVRTRRSAWRATNVSYPAV